MPTPQPACTGATGGDGSEGRKFRLQSGANTGISGGSLFPRSKHTEIKEADLSQTPWLCLRPLYRMGIQGEGVRSFQAADRKTGTQGRSSHAADSSDEPLPGSADLGSKEN